MRDICMHILDLTQNSVDAAAKNVNIVLEESRKDNIMSLTIEDDGLGMSPEMLARLTSPFTTTRTTRKVGMGTSLMDMVCRQTNGKMNITSTVNVGTKVVATMQLDHLDRPPLGDLVGTLKLMLLTFSEKVNFCFTYVVENKRFGFSTKEIKEAFGEEVSLSEPEVTEWLNDFLRANIKGLKEDAL